MARTFVPQLANMARRMNTYVVKHDTTLQQALAPADYTALQNCLACLRALSAYARREQP